MQKTTAWISVLAVAALLAPGAAAGTAEEPEIEDAALDAPAGAGWGDILRAWMELSDDGQTLHVNVEVMSLPETMPGVALVYAFESNGTTWYGAAATAPTLATWWGVWSDRGPVDNRDTTGTWTPGAPGRIRVDVPTADLGVEATAHHAMAWDIKPQLVGVDPPLADEGVGDVPFALRLSPADAPVEVAAAPEVPSPPLSVALPSVGLVLAGLGVGALGFRRRE